MVAQDTPQTDTAAQPFETSETGVQEINFGTAAEWLEWASLFG